MVAVMRAGLGIVLQPIKDVIVNGIGRRRDHAPALKLVVHLPDQALFLALEPPLGEQSRKELVDLLLHLLHLLHERPHSILRAGHVDLQLLDRGHLLVQAPLLARDLGK